MSTNVNLEPAQIISYFVRRWQIEVTVAETRAYLGVETQRQWNDKAIMRTTPSLLGHYRLVTLWACDLLGQGARPYAAAWYKKTDWTPLKTSPFRLFSDSIGLCDLQGSDDAWTAWVLGFGRTLRASECRR